MNTWDVIMGVVIINFFLKWAQRVILLVCKVSLSFHVSFLSYRGGALCAHPPLGIRTPKKPRGNRVKPIPECSGQVSKAPKEFQLWCRRRQNSKYFPVSSNLKNVVVLCGTNNLLLDASKDIADGILEIARSFEINYSCVNVIICGILSRDDSYLYIGCPLKR